VLGSTEPGGLEIALVTGMGGVGKSQLVVYWVRHHLKESFPGGQLCADLGELRRDGAVDPGAVAAGFLRALHDPVREHARARAARGVSADRPATLRALTDHFTSRARETDRLVMGPGFRFYEEPGGSAQEFGRHGWPAQRDELGRPEQALESLTLAAEWAGTVNSPNWNRCSPWSADAPGGVPSRRRVHRPSLDARPAHSALTVAVAVAVLGEDRCLVGLRNGRTLEADAPHQWDAPRFALDRVLLGAAMNVWVTDGEQSDDLDHGLTYCAGGRSTVVRLGPQPTE
jgi:hypothetical protein